MTDKLQIRPLKAEEIECRVQTVKETGCSLLLYKDARCDMRILDEVFGPLNWQRHHDLINGNLFCTVSVWDSNKEQWIYKQDIGTESNMDKAKGQASDSFKRACFNLGIGRELYTAPFIWIKLDQSDIFKQRNGNVGVKTKFKVSKITYNNNKEIESLEIADQYGNVRWPNNQKTVTPPNAESKQQNKHTNNSSGKCSECEVEIKPAVKTFSEKNFKKPLCRACQDKYKEGE